MKAVKMCSREAQTEPLYKSLNDAYSTLAALNMMVGNKAQFQKDLHAAVTAHLKVEYHGLLEAAIVKFLKERGLPL